MKDQPIHHYIPEWMIKKLEDRQCGQCGHSIGKIDIIAIGIRENKKKDKALYMEHRCSSCEYREMTSCGDGKKGTLDEMCYILIEEMQRRKSIEKAQELKKVGRVNKPITDKEVEDFKTFMHKCPSHDHFMKHIHASHIKEEQDNDDEKPSTED